MTTPDSVAVIEDRRAEAFATTVHSAADCCVGSSSHTQTAARPLTVSPKIQARHRERLAYVYVRQSSPQQVINNRESRERQYALVERAVELGWPRERVRVIDEDQGQSGKSADARNGFQKILVDVSLDHVGIILGLEMSKQRIQTPILFASSAEFLGEFWLG